MFTVVITVIMIVAILLILVILAQNSKGGGLSSQFGGSGTQIMGVKKTGDLLERVTWTLAIILLVLSLSTNFMIDDVEETGVVSPNVERAQERTVLPDFNAPGEENNQQNGEQQSLEDLLEEPGAATEE